VRRAGLQPVDLQVGEQEGLRVGGAFEGDAGLLADCALSTVAADQVTGADRLGPAVAVAELAGDLLVRLVDGDQLGAALDQDAVAGQMLAEDALGLGLGEEQQVRVGGVGDAEVEQPQGDGAAGQVRPELDSRVAVVEQLAGHAVPGEDFQGAWLDGQGA
jgi:hypothetical protein